MLTDAQCRAAKPREGIYRLNDYKGLYLGKVCKTSRHPDWREA